MQGFVISDWQGVDKISSPPHSNYTASVRAAIQAGIDMVLVFPNFTDTLCILIIKNFFNSLSENNIAGHGPFQLQRVHP